MTRKPRGKEPLPELPQSLVPDAESPTPTSAPSTGPGTGPKKKPVPGGDELQKAVGEKVLQARKAAGWSQSQLAREADCPLSTVFTVENGVHNLSLNTLLRLSTALKLDMRALLPGPELEESFVATTSASLKAIEEALESSLKNMGHTTLLLQQVRKLQSDLLKPAHLRSGPTK
ncbi:Transcriptional regulator, Cro/CI family (plasmid) [Roseomonas mucosa]|nr:Transcriptional regulator, Cro/CI family [Roseomonas mucosa]